MKLHQLSPLTYSLAMVAALASCAQDRPEISRVQPNVTAKASLLGDVGRHHGVGNLEWYMRSTVIETGFTVVSAFPGSMSKLVRGVFDVQENGLYFYRTYEFLAGSEAFSQKSDTDIALKGKDGKPAMRSVPQDFQQISCKVGGDSSECRKEARCANRWRTDGLWPEEAQHHGFCVQKATKYIYRGAPVLAYPIRSHFDQTHSYSAATGEQTNVLEENTFDKHWYDREYMRVAWGSQQIMSFDHDVLGEVVAHGNSPVIYEGDNAPEDEKFETGKTVLNDTVPQSWFQYVVRVVAHPPTTYLEGWGEIPICFFYPWSAGGVYDCASEELKVRYSFLQVPKFEKEPERAYVARDSDDIEMEKFGYFRTERPTYDLQFGNTHGGALRRMQRHRVWDKYVKCHVDPKAASGPTGKPVCVAETKDTVWRGDFDYAKMKPVPIVYYLNEDHPRELVPESKEIGRKWSEPLEDIVAFHKGKKPDHPMFIVCENSDEGAKAAIAKGLEVAEWSGSKNAAAKKFCKMEESHKFGDVRWSMMHAVPNPIQVGLYGYGPSAADPITGEVISASAHAYAGVMKSGAESALQTIELLAGVKDFNDIRRAHEKIFNSLKLKAKTQDARNPRMDDPQGVQAVQAAVDGMIDEDVRLTLETTGLPFEANGGNYAQARLAMIQQSPELDAMVSGDDDGHSIAALLRDPAVLLSKDPSLKTLSKDQLKKYSLAAWNHTSARIEREKVSNALGIKTIHMAEFADNAILGLATQYGLQYDQAFCQKYAATTDHLFSPMFAEANGGACETVGAFESFEVGKGRVCVQASAGKQWAACATSPLMQKLRLALNAANANDPALEAYKLLPGPLYTDTADQVIRTTQEIGRELMLSLRTKFKLELWRRIYLGTQEHEVGHTVGLRHNFEASTDALNFHKKFWDLKLKPGSTDEVLNPLSVDTVEQARAGIRETQLASVMDYTSKFNGRGAGVGNYDRAAIKFGYGNMVEAFNTIKPSDLDKDPDGTGPLAAPNKYLETPDQTTPGVKMVRHDGNQNLNIINRRLHYTSLPKYLGGVAAMYDRKDISWLDLRGDRCIADDTCPNGGKCMPLGEDKFCRDDSVVEVPYRFCSDEYNGQTPSCSTFDEGVDPYEIARNALDDYESYWWFYGYSRDSETFHPQTYSSRVQRAFWTATRQFQYWAVDFATYQKNDWWQKKFGQDYDKDLNGGLSGAYATLLSFNTMAQVLARPSCGYYGWNPVKARFEPYTSVDNAQFADLRRVDETVGCRPLYPSWDYNGYVTRPETGGQIYDRLAAMTMLADPTMTGRIAFNENEDLRRFMVSFYNVFPRQLTNLLASISVEDASYYGWQILQGKTAKEDELVRRNWVGGNAGNQAKLCSDFKPSATDAEKQGCLKYNVFPDGRPTFPSSRFRLPLQAAYYGMAVLTKGFTRTYLDVSRVFLDGHFNKIELPDSVAPEDIAKFTDPLSGKTFIAPRVAKDTLNPGFMAVQLAQAELKKWKQLGQLQDNYLFSEYQYRVSLLDIMRTLHELYEK